MWEWLRGLFGPRFAGAPRSGAWDRVRDQFLRGCVCQACGARDSLEAHHIEPFHERPELELDVSNLVALCRRCHFVFGHLGCWQCSNPKVIEDATQYRSRVEQYRGGHHGKP